MKKDHSLKEIGISWPQLGAFAIGCEMILKFPYGSNFDSMVVVYQNGGLTFLIPYMIIVLILIIPVTYLEIALGPVN
jgi:SNF family Na+-dependent transporter